MKRLLRSPLLWSTFVLVLALAVTAAWLSIAPPPELRHLASVTDEKRTLDRAVRAYTDYQVVVNAIYGDGGKNASRVEAVATHEAAADVVENADWLRSADRHYRGGWAISGGELVNRMIDEFGRTYVVIRICSDATGVAVIDSADGDDVTNSAWTERRQVVEATLIALDDDSDELTPVSDVTLAGETCAEPTPPASAEPSPEPSTKASGE